MKINEKILTFLILMVLTIGVVFAEEGLQIQCSDSDGGKNYFVKGTTSGMTKTYYNGTESEKYSSSEDICVKDNQIPQSGYEEGLFEHYCENNYLQVYGSDKTFICPNVCEDGACVS